MIKRTIYVGNPLHLSISNEQLVLSVPHAKGMDKLVGNTVPLEDIGILMLDHNQITLSHAVLQKMASFNIAFIVCNESHHPVSLQLPLATNTLQTERFKYQIEASAPLKKQLWQQTVKTKIRNQAFVLNKYGFSNASMLQWANDVNSGDTMNLEGRAAAFYWKSLSPLLAPNEPLFLRDREGVYPNNLLNYAYAIIRATVARALVASGLLPTLGIHHKNKYNAYCLADDMMEPYRAYADDLVFSIVKTNQTAQELTKEIKSQLLSLPATEIFIDKQRSPLMVGLQKTTSSLVKCYMGDSKRILFPELLQ
ncbi:MAG: type II CRISPR-associated endonuclease Cas1 [Bacteroidia bacterium]